MEEEDDLELLRLAALKSLNIKKDASTTNMLPSTVPTVPKAPRTSNNVGHRNTVRSCHIAVTNPAFAPAPSDAKNGDKRREYRDYKAPIESYSVVRLDQPMDMNDAYSVQSRQPSSLVADYGRAANYVPHVSNTDALPIPNVQLSPRSAAFVLQNNDALMRRKGGRSRSASPYRNDAKRWSVSPPPLVKHRSPNHSPSHHYYRRSESRSPVPRPRSPRRSPRRLPQKRTQSRSPPRYPHTRRYSPSQAKRSRTRSPNRSAFAHRGRSRSPLHPSNRRHSPNRNGPKNWTGQSPGHQAQSGRQNGGSSQPQQNSQSPRKDHPAVSGRPTDSSKLDGRKRSNSRSPGRNYGRDGPTGKKRKSPTFLNRNKPNRNDNGVGNSNTVQVRSYRRDRSPSPRHRRRSGSRLRNQPSKSMAGVHKTSDERKIDDEQKSTEMKKVTENTSVTQTNVDSNARELPEKSVTHKEVKEIEEDIQPSSDEESNNDDGIDLFASEESESENEGRFKSSSKTERTTTAATLSFSQLGATNAPVVRDLNEVHSDKTSSSRKGREDIGGNRRDRDRRNRNGRDNYSSRRNERFGGRKSPSIQERERSRGRGGGGSWENDARKDTSERDDDKYKKNSSKFSGRAHDSRKVVSEEGKPQSFLFV